ncbi:hypothetical protein H0H92_006050 [Tricholoma furcatifolium]|nr:hypothetical protein H0H92_006050 [Tricholoma furcatifolium]
MSTSTVHTLPASHPSINDHSHPGNTCPATGKSYKWCPAGAGDSRSPCPALNTMANHGYLPRSGKNLSVWDLVFGLKACYSLSTPLALFLSFGGFALLRRFPFTRIDLEQIGEHGKVEHDASLVHDDTPYGQKYAPIKIEPRLVDALIADAHHKGAAALMDANDVAKARVRREKASPKLDGVHAEIARGEMAIILGVWETRMDKDVGVPAQWLREWIGSERLPSDWKATHTQGLLDVVRRAKEIRAGMESIRAKEKAE